MKWEEQQDRERQAKLEAFHLFIHMECAMLDLMYILYILYNMNVL